MRRHGSTIDEKTTNRTSNEEDQEEIDLEDLKQSRPLKYSEIDEDFSKALKQGHWYYTGRGCGVVLALICVIGIGIPLWNYMFDPGS